MSIGYKTLVTKMEEEQKKVCNKFMEYIFSYIDGNLQYNNLDSKINNNYWLIALINNIFDPNFPLENKVQFLNELKNNDVKIIKYDNQMLILEYNNKQFVFNDVCSMFKQFKKKDFTADINYYKKDVYIPILLKRIRELKYESKIVIGYIKEETLNSKRLLSWIEVLKNGKEYIIDFVHNIVIEKNSFYMVYKPEVLNEISKEDILDENILSILVSDLSIQYDEYLIFDKEFKNEIQKKKELFLLK